MCMDVFSPGHCIDIEYYLEQIWIEASKEIPDEINTVEVYDLCLRNCKGSPVLDTLWLLFPHDYTQKDEERKPTIEVFPMSPQVCAQQQDFEWAYIGSPDRSQHSGEHVTRKFFSEPPSLGGHNYDSLKGKLLESVDEGVRFPPDLRPEHLELLASPKVRKTLVCLKLKDPIKEGEKGWIRIMCHPQRLGTMKPKKKKLPFGNGVNIYEYRLSIPCPIIVRQTLEIRLDDPNLTNDTNIHKHCEHIRKVALTNGAFFEGTSTRITDHRIALIVEDDIEVSDITCVGSMAFLDRIPPLEEKGYTAILWHGGSNTNPNRPSDIVFNAKRAIDMVLYNGPKKIFDLVLALSPSGKHEAFSLFIDKMIKVGLFNKLPNDLLALPDNLDTTDLCNDHRITDLRRLYAASSLDRQVKLLEEFVDLHPFRIDYKLKWYNT